MNREHAVQGGVQEISACSIPEIGARTEQYWCPIKHASGKARPHSRYHQFADYGDAAAYLEKLDTLRRKYEDAD